MPENRPVSFAPAQTKRASEVIYEQIYQKIVSGELKPGDRLPAERELAEQFRRSRPSIREALRMLQQDGLLEITVGTNGGAIVRGVSLASAAQPLRKLVDLGAITINDLVDYRAYNERSCGELAIRYRTDQDIRTLEEIMERYHAAVYDSETVSKVDIEFHTAMANASHNPLCILINDIVTTLCANLFWGIAADNMTSEKVIEVNRRACACHQQMLDALIARDLETMNKVIQVNMDLYFDFVDPSHLKVSANPAGMHRFDRPSDGL